MSSNEIYRKKFAELCFIEDRFVNLYKYHANHVKDSNILEKLKHIYNEEKKHCEIAKGFVDKLSK